MIRYKHIKYLAEVLEYPYEKVLRAEALSWTLQLLRESQIIIRGVSSISNNSLHATFSYIDYKDKSANGYGAYNTYTLFEITKDTHIIFNRCIAEKKMFDLFSLLKNDCGFSDEKIKNFMRPIVRATQRKYMLNKKKTPKYFVSDINSNGWLQAKRPI